MMDTHEPDDAAHRRQAFIRTLQLTPAGTGLCPSCSQEAERFVKRPSASKDTKPRCLECWKAER